MKIIKKPCQHDWVQVVPGVLKCAKCGIEKKTGQGSASIKKTGDGDEPSKKTTKAS